MRLNGRFETINSPKTEEETIDCSIARTAPRTVIRITCVRWTSMRRLKRD